MPLIKGKSIKRDMGMESESSGKPSLAIAFGMQRRAKKKMAKGGEVDLREEKESGIDDASDSREMDMLDGHSTKHKEEMDLRKEKMANIDDEMMMAEGGELDDLREESPKTIAEAVMRRRRMMAKGGEVDIQDNGREDPNSYDDLNRNAAKGAAYFDDSQLEAQPMDSNEHGDELSDEDKHGAGMIAEIMRKMKSKRS